MDWIQWLVPLIALVVWILVNLMKVPENKNQPPKPPGQVPRGGGPGQAKNDLERFIEEARRRRQTPEQRWAQDVAPPPTVKAAAPAIPRVRPNPQPSRMPSAQAVPPSQPIPVLPVIKKPAYVPPTRQPEPEPIVATEVITEPPSNRADTTRMLSAYTLRERAVLTSGSGAARQVTQMLGDPNAARIALLLREILDRPISMRLRRR